MKTLYRAARVRTLAHPETGEWLMLDGRHVQRIGSGEPPTADRVVDLPADGVRGRRLGVHGRADRDEVPALGHGLDELRVEQVAIDPDDG